ncbi:MAG: hypothetical protein JSS66_06395 [Armatimonadetes bacterium]|nr:hypothetical protein [Armatimonadota bacterium]
MRFVYENQEYSLVFSYGTGQSKHAKFTRDVESTRCQLWVGVVGSRDEDKRTLADVVVKRNVADVHNKYEARKQALLKLADQVPMGLRARLLTTYGQSCRWTKPKGRVSKKTLATA